MFSSDLLMAVISGFISFIFGLLTMTLSDRVPFFSKAKYKRQLKIKFRNYICFKNTNIKTMRCYTK